MATIRVATSSNRLKTSSMFLLEEQFFEGAKPIWADEINSVKSFSFDYVERYSKVEG